MTSTTRYDAVIFDLLTALINSWELWNQVAGSPEAGLRWRRKYLELTYGAGAYRPYEAIVGEAALSAGVAADCADALVRRWGELPPWPETRRVLSVLATRVPLAVATNCSQTLGKAAAAIAGGPFVTVVTAEAAGHYKPHPAPYQAALAALGTRPERTLFVAGSASDVPGARRVGMPVFWHNRMGLPRLDDNRPDVTASSLDPLLDLI
jgi:2-haloalkanoic acid dehalogenase type II